MASAFALSLRLATSGGWVFRTTRLSSIAAIVVWTILSSAPTQAQILVGTYPASQHGTVLSINAGAPSPGVQGTFGSATNFDPWPGCMARDSARRIYILDANPDVLRKFDSNGNSLGNFQSSGFKVNGLYYGLAIDAADNVYISSDGPLGFDPSDDAIVRFDHNGTPLGSNFKMRL